MRILWRVGLPAERDRIRLDQVFVSHGSSVYIIAAFQTAYISTAVGQSCFIKNCENKPAVVNIGAVRRDERLGASGKIGCSTGPVVRQNCLVVVYNDKPSSVKGHRSDSRIYWRVQIIGQIIGTQRNLVQSVRILRQDADAPLGLLDADELLRFGYVYIIIFRLKIRYRQLLQSVTCFAVD